MISSRLRLSQTGSIGKLRYKKGRALTASGTFLFGETINIELFIPRSLGVTDTRLVLFSEDGNEILKVCGSWTGPCSGDDVYLYKIGKSRLVAGLYFYTVELNSQCGIVYAHPAPNGVAFSPDPGCSRFQITVSDFKYNTPSISDGVIYHIFVDRFNRGGKITRPDGAVYVDDWSYGIPEYPLYPGAPLKNNTFYGGTLYGIIKKLPYIASLGTSAIYLSPIFESVSNHKYDTADYMRVDPMFGGDKALKKLIDAASEYGISIILDGVFNHTGSDSRYFNRYSRYDSIGAYNSMESPYYSWYDFKRYPDDYTSWWGIEILPRINPDEPSCRSFFVGEHGVIEKYSKMGIGGFRLDVVDELSDGFVKDIKSKLNEHNPNSVLYGEVWEDASNKIAYDKRKTYYLGDELDGVMNYPLRRGIIAFLCGKGSDLLKYALTDIVNNAPERIRNMQMNLLGTHDTDRILTVLGGESPDGKDNAYLRDKRMTPEERAKGIQKLKMAYTMLATLPGIPVIFYGDEAGLEGYHDPFNRMPYPWGNEEASLVCHYQKLGEIRRSSNAFSSGSFELLHIDDELVVFKRNSGRDVFITIINNSKKRINVRASAKIKPQISTDMYVDAGSAEIFKTPRKAYFYLD
ncbi:MAG: glycoside hydrolase family 13 protein [Clostridia bacterium]|nr:glycoside hydrolase family 13 protein [Clostridia bacterium]